MKSILCFCLFSILLMACKKDSGSSDADYYFVGQLDGADLKFEITDSSSDEMIISNSSSLNPPICTYSYGCDIGTGPGTATEKSISVSFQQIFQGDCGDQLTVFPSLFPKGDYVVGEDSGNVLITYFDGTDNWTSYGVLQTGANFEITESEVVESPFGSSQKIHGKCSCILYNISGESKKLEDVSFVLSFWPEI